MSRKFLSNIDLAKNELQNAVIQRLASAPSSPAEGQVYYNTTDDTIYVWANGAWLDLGATGSGDMLKATYDPQNKNGDAFSTDNHTDGTTNKVFTATEKTKLAGIEAGADVTDATNVDAAGAVMNSDTSTAAMSFAIDEDNMASDSATKLPTQQSVKAYVDNNLQGLSWKQAVRVATTANGALATAFENGDTIDGITLATGDRILIKNQTDQTENGIYVVAASGAPTRASDANTGTEIRGATVYVEEGTANADTVWNQTTNATITLGSTNIVFALVHGGTVPTASTTVEGKVELATAGEAEARSDSTRATTPSSLANFPVKKIFTIGDNSATSIAVTHNLGTKDVITQVRQASDDAVVECDIVNTSTTQVTLTFAVAPATNALKVVVMG